MGFDRHFQMLRLGVRNLAGYPLRTLLTTLGVVFGVGSVIAMLALGKGAEEEILREIGRLGIRNIIINSVKPQEAETDTSSQRVLSYGLKFKDLAQIRATVSNLEQVLPVHFSRESVWWGSKQVEATVYAVQPEHMDLFDLNAVRGRSIGVVDNVSLARVCVIRDGLLRQLGIYEDPIGLDLFVGEETYRVIGILRDEEFQGYAQKALAIDAKTTELYVPYETVLKRKGTVSSITRAGYRETTNVELSQIVLSVEDIDQVLMTSRLLERILIRNHEDRDFEMVVPLEVLAQRKKTQQVFSIALIAIASISLLVGGIGIANIMLATVTERTKEIGIRRALGARKHHIMSQFLTECITISMAGGLLGVLVGFGFVLALTAFTGWNARVTAGSVLLALSISVCVGVLSGIFPARRAANLDPIAALCHE